MINIATISDALRSLLVSSKEVTSIIVSEIQRGDYINNRTENTPWIGVYRAGVKYEPLTMGANAARSSRGLVSMKVVIQESSADSGRDCEDKLEKAVNVVLTAIRGDMTLNGNVAALTTMDIDYSYNMQQQETVFFQNATITLEYEARTS